MLISTLKLRLKSLEKAIEELKPHLRNSSDIFAAPPCEEYRGEAESADLIALFLRDFYLADDTEDGRKTSVCVGAMSLSPQGIAKVKEINQIKEEVTDAINALKSSLVSRTGEPLSPAGRSSAFRRALLSAGLGRLSVKQCERKIPIIDENVVSIRFSYSTQGRSLVQITPEEAIILLDKSGFDSVKTEIERKHLSNLAPDTPLVQSQELAGYYKANVTLKGGGKLTIPTSVPIAFLQQDEKVVRQLSVPNNFTDPEKKRKPRNDKKIEEFPIASSIRVYSYREA